MKNRTKYSPTIGWQVYQTIKVFYTHTEVFITLSDYCYFLFQLWWLGVKPPVSWVIPGYSCGRHWPSVNNLCHVRIICQSPSQWCAGCPRHCKDAGRKWVNFDNLSCNAGKLLPSLNLGKYMKIKDKTFAE